MSTEISFNYDDVLVAKDEEGKEYYLGIYQDDRCCDWVQDECPVGHLVTWHRKYTIGEDHAFEYPEDFWRNVIMEHYGKDSSKSAEENKQRAKAYFRLLLDYSNVYIKEETEAVGTSVYLLCHDSRNGRISDYNYDYHLSTNDPDKFTEFDETAMWDILDCLTVEEFESMANQIPDFVYYHVYMYDHSGIALSISNAHYPFNDRWDAGCLGVWYADKEDVERNFGKKEDWEKQFHRYVTEAIEEFNELESGNVWGFAYADKEDIDSRIGQFKNRRWWDQVVKGEITYYAKDSCWGYIGDYEELILDFCKDEHLTITGVAEA